MPVANNGRATRSSSMSRRIISAREALDIDVYQNVEAWGARYATRMRNAGFTEAEIEERGSAMREKYATRDAVRATLGGYLAKRYGLPERADMFSAALTPRNNGSEEAPISRGAATAELDNEMVSWILSAISGASSLPVILRPGYNFERAARHYAYFSKKSPRIRTGFERLVTNMVSAMNDAGSGNSVAHRYYKRALSSSKPNAVLDFIRSVPAFENITCWAPDGGYLGFYDSNRFVKCPLTDKMFPDPRYYQNTGVQVIVELSGRTQYCHPDVLNTELVQRDVVLNSNVLTKLGKWIDLVDGGRCVRELSEPRGAIEHDEEAGGWVLVSGDGRVAGYHNASRPWRDNNRRIAERSIGVELELSFSDDAKFRQFLGRFVDSSGRFRTRPFSIETDSSVGSIPNGCEIISDPLPLAEGYTNEDSHWRWLLSTLYKYGAKGWKHRHVAGIHVNLDVRHLSTDQVALFAAFVNNAAAISKFVSGRKGIYGAGGSMDPGRDSEMLDFDEYAKTHKLNGCHGSGYSQMSGTPKSLYETVLSRGKYQPVNIRSSRHTPSVIEVRIFGSNIKYEGFMSCVEYCLAGVDFVSTSEGAAAVFESDVSQKFLDWLDGNSESYPNLSARLARAEKKKAKVTVAQLAETFSA